MSVTLYWLLQRIEYLLNIFTKCANLCKFLPKHSAYVIKGGNLIHMTTMIWCSTCKYRGHEWHILETAKIESPYFSRKLYLKMVKI